MTCGGDLRTRKISVSQRTTAGVLWKLHASSPLLPATGRSALLMCGGHPWQTANPNVVRSIKGVQEAQVVRREEQNTVVVGCQRFCAVQVRTFIFDTRLRRDGDDAIISSHPRVSRSTLVVFFNDRVALRRRQVNPQTPIQTDEASHS